MNRSILTQEFESVTPETRAGKLRSDLQTNSTAAVLVGDDEIEGAVLPRDLLRSRLSDDAQAQTVMGTVPKPAPTAETSEIARVLVESESTVAPLVDEAGVRGIVTRDSLLRAVDTDFDAINVESIYTQDPVTVDRKTKMGKVVNIVRENGISRVPVVDDDELVGIATTDDLVEFVVRGTDTATKGDRRGEKRHLVDLPVENVMSRPAETTTPSATVGSALETMFEKGYDGLVVADGSSVERPLGVLTKTDVLRAITDSDTPDLDVQVVNPEYFREIDWTAITERIEGVTEKYQELDVFDARVTVQKHEENHRGESLMRCEVRLFTDEDRVAGTGEEYGAANAFDAALETLEKNVLELKGKQTDRDRNETVPRKP
ncbi:CBS domain-containing protein [Haloarcula salina]|uniref:CBS domain-containing protein n=1 Tax=Haloarcula salina TaxID=1429914 RepID=UPI003C6F2E9D